MILATLGKLSIAQALTDADDISDNVISMTAADWAGMTDVWLTVDTNVVAATSGTIKIALVVATAANLSTSQEVVSALVAAITEARVANAGRHIIAVNVGKMLKEMMEDSGDTYYFVGLKTDLSTGVTITIYASLSPTEPQTLHHKMQTESNVTTPAIASAGSGTVV